MCKYLIKTQLLIYKFLVGTIEHNAVVSAWPACHIVVNRKHSPWIRSLFYFVRPCAPMHKHSPMIFNIHEWNWKILSVSLSPMCALTPNYPFTFRKSCAEQQLVWICAQATFSTSTPNAQHGHTKGFVIWSAHIPSDHLTEALLRPPHSLGHAVRPSIKNSHSKASSGEQILIRYPGTG